MNAKLSFHPVGQGCFYSGLISLKSKNDFSFVYDCGTLSKRNYLDNEIDEFKAEINCILNLLIISHFDEDHVNGVKRLLTGVHCKRLIIPYYEPIERLLIYATTLSDDNDYFQMLRNPIAYFSNSDLFNIEEIIIVGGPDNNINLSDSNISPKSPSNISPENIISQKFEFEDQYDDTNAKVLAEKILTAEGNESSTKIKFVMVPYKLTIGISIWEFVFYLKKMENFLLKNSFKNDVDQILAIKSISLFELFDEENINELKQAYRGKYGTNLNSTSFVLYHGPLCNSSNPCFHNQKQSNCSYHERMPNNQSGTLLTGDIDINGPRKISNITEYFGSYMDQVFYFQIPHHGSTQNWYIMPAYNSLHNFRHYIINHGLGRTHHPSIAVIDDLKSKCTDSLIHLNNEVHPFIYYIIFQLDQCPPTK